MARAQVEMVFAPELTELAGRRQELLDGLHAINIWSFWESLRTRLDLGPGRTQDLLRATVTALLGEAGFL